MVNEKALQYLKSDVMIVLIIANKAVNSNDDRSCVIKIKVELKCHPSSKCTRLKRTGICFKASMADRQVREQCYM